MLGLLGTLEVSSNTDSAMGYFPKLDSFGVDTFYYSITDTTNLHCQGLINIEIRKAINTLYCPCISVQGRADMALLIDFSDYLVDKDMLLSSVTVRRGNDSIPLNGKLIFDNRREGVLAYHPNAHFFGLDQFEYQVFDRALSSCSNKVKVEILPRLSDNVELHCQKKRILTDGNSAISVDPLELVTSRASLQCPVTFKLLSFPRFGKLAGRWLAGKDPFLYIETELSSQGKSFSSLVFSNSDSYVFFFPLSVTGLSQLRSVNTVNMPVQSQG